MSKLDQLRALRERQFATAKPVARPKPASAVTPIPPDPPAAAFDRVAYQREYMKRWRARKKAAADRSRLAEGVPIATGEESETPKP